MKFNVFIVTLSLFFLGINGCGLSLINSCTDNSGSCQSGSECICTADLLGVCTSCGCRAPQPTCSPACQNGGLCVSSNTCNCVGTGYTGSLCSTPICSINVCMNGGLCTAPETCNCDDTGYAGLNCTIPLCSTECSNHGTCVGPENCLCDVDYMGADCSIAVVVNYEWVIQSGSCIKTWGDASVSNQKRGQTGPTGPTGKTGPTYKTGFSGPTYDNSCWGGYQERAAVCRNRANGLTVDDTLCSGVKPTTTRINCKVCNVGPTYEAKHTGPTGPTGPTGRTGFTGRTGPTGPTH